MNLAKRADSLLLKGGGGEMRDVRITSNVDKAKTESQNNIPFGLRLNDEIYASVCVCVVRGSP